MTSDLMRLRREAIELAFKRTCIEDEAAIQTWGDWIMAAPEMSAEDLDRAAKRVLRNEGQLTNLPEEMYVIRRTYGSQDKACDP